MRKCVLGGIGLMLLLAGSAAQAGVVGSVYDPNDYASLGVLTPAVSLVFDTSALTVVVDGGPPLAGVAALNQSGNVEAAVFAFSSVNIAAGIPVTVTGNRALVLASQGNLTVNSEIDVSGENGHGPGDNSNTQGGLGGPGAEGGVRSTSYQSNPPGNDRGKGGQPSNKTGVGYGAGAMGGGAAGAGGSYGGLGGGPYQGGGVGSTYGDDVLTDLFGGSGAGGGAYGAGGGGGGALELVASGVLSVGGTLRANGGNGGGGSGYRAGGGGSGGGILLAGTDLVFTGTVEAVGGKGQTGNGDDVGGGGGGGRIAFYYANSLLNTGTVDVSGGLGGNRNNQFFGEPGEDGTFAIVQTAAPVPEPAGLGLLGLALLGWRKRRG